MTITPEEQAVLDALEAKGYDVRVKEPYVEPEPTPEEALETLIREQSDCVESVYIPKNNNPFGNITRSYVESMTLAERIVKLWHYTALLNDSGEAVGNEGGIHKVLIEQRGKSVVDGKNKLSPLRERKDTDQDETADIKDTMHAINDRRISK